MKQSLHSEVLRLLSALFSLSSQAAICRFSMILTPQGPFQGFSPSPKHGALFFRHVCTGPFLDLSEWSFSLSFVLTSYCMKLSILVLPCAPLPVALLSYISIYTSTSKQTITLDGPPEPPTRSYKNPGEWRTGREWEHWEGTNHLLMLT